MNPRMIVPSIFFCFMSIQFYLVFFQGFTPWKGGAFGMFSTIDERDITFEFVTKDTTLKVEWVDFVGDQRKYARKLPTKRNLDALFKEMQYKRLYNRKNSEEVYTRLPDDEEDYQTLDMERITFLHWHIVYDNTNNEIKRELKGKLSYDY